MEAYILAGVALLLVGCATDEEKACLLRDAKVRERIRELQDEIAVRRTIPRKSVASYSTR